ncbi:OprO/OprP family phosphate-selective porin [bacterium]|nr:OprO/OprP family phosphate-selective porin [Rhodopirellula sp.]MDB4476624.1 OprO/OprP family phosphate-selective porin [Rhodopirellula sp.]MDB4540358.1 OprO/OprP family phosphate-selective porin [bacterium]
MKCVREWVHCAIAFTIAGTGACAVANQAIANERPALTQALDMEESNGRSQNIIPTNHNAVVWDEGTEVALEADVAIEDQFIAMQERLATMEAELEEVAAKAGDKSIVRSGSSKSTMKVSGRVHVDAWGFDPTGGDVPLLNSRGGDPVDPQNRIGFRRLRFGVKGTIRDNMNYKIELELAGGNKSEFRDAYLGWTDLPVLQTLLLGNQKRPYGLDHLNSSRYNVFLERPFVIEANNQDARRLGLASYGYSDNLRWNWRYGVWNQQNVQGLGNYVGDHLQLEVAGRLASTLWYDDVSGGRGYMHMAISGAHADTAQNDTNEARFRTRPEARSSNRWIDTNQIEGSDYYNLLGLETVVNVGPVQFVGEYQSVWVNRDFGGEDVNFNGGYFYVSYFLTGEHMPWDRKSGTLARIVPFQNFWMVDRCDGGREAGWGAWQIAARYSKADYSDENVFGGVGESFTFGLNWYWNANARMQFNYINGKIGDRTVGNTQDVSGDYDIYGVRWMVDF